MPCLKCDTFVFFFKPCISLESAVIEALDKFTASETLKIMQVSTFMHVIRDTSGHFQGDFATTCDSDKILVVLPISRTRKILLYSSWESCIQLTVVILTFKTDGFSFC